jgi:hypothetical protein
LEVFGLVRALYARTQAKEALVSILQRHQIQVLVDIRGVPMKVFEDLLNLLFLREHPRRQEPSQLQPLALFISKGGW